MKTKFQSCGGWETGRIILVLINLTIVDTKNEQKFRTKILAEILVKVIQARTSVEN